MYNQMNPGPINFKVGMVAGHQVVCWKSWGGSEHPKKEVIKTHKVIWETGLYLFVYGCVHVHSCPEGGV